MTQAERSARQTLKRTGCVEYHGWEIWETQTPEGYTGHYRMAPRGQREHYREFVGSTHTLRALFARIHHDHQEQEP